MPSITEDGKLRRRQINESVLGTNAMEGLTLDAEALALMRRFKEGELTRQQLPAAIDVTSKLFSPARLRLCPRQPDNRARPSQP